CWISSLRDGMNLVAKEYIAAQDPENPGVLILSKYAGAAEQMTQALIVDPLDRAAMMDSLKTALEMSKAERINRYEQLIEGLAATDLSDWRNNFLKDLENSPTFT
ncbi:trehalose-6-phosphate synthase, partial [Acinetobacter baumannii]